VDCDSRIALVGPNGAGKLTNTPPNLYTTGVRLFTCLKTFL